MFGALCVTRYLYRNYVLFRTKNVKALSFAFFQRSNLHRKAFTELCTMWSGFSLMISIQITPQLFESASLPGEFIEWVDRGRLKFKKCVEIYNFQITNIIHDLDTINALLEEEHLQDELYKLYKIWVYPIKHTISPFLDEMIRVFDELESQPEYDIEKLAKLNYLCEDIDKLIDILVNITLCLK